MQFGGKENGSFWSRSVLHCQGELIDCRRGLGTLISREVAAAIHKAVSLLLKRDVDPSIVAIPIRIRRRIGNGVVVLTLIEIVAQNSHDIVVVEPSDASGGLSDVQHFTLF